MKKRGPKKRLVNLVHVKFGSELLEELQETTIKRESPSDSETIRQAVKRLALETRLEKDGYNIIAEKGNITRVLTA